MASLDGTLPSSSALGEASKAATEGDAKFENKRLRSLLEKCACTSMNSKLISRNQAFFAPMCVDAVLSLGGSLDLNMIGIKKVAGGSVTESELVKGVAFKKTFSYAGFEQQPKSFAHLPEVKVRDSLLLG